MEGRNALPQGPVKEPPGSLQQGLQTSAEGQKGLLLRKLPTL